MMLGNFKLITYYSLLIIIDTVCQVYAGRKSREIIDLVLNTFIPGYEKLNLDYTYPRHDKDYIFQNRR